MKIVKPQTAQSAMVRDVIYRPPAKVGGGAHIELVTGITADEVGTVTHVRVEESRPQTTLETNYDVKSFNSHIGSKGRQLYRITDLDAWRADNRADAFLFPNYEENSAEAVINQTLLLDRGDWVPYRMNEAVKLNIMDREEKGVEDLVIMNGDTVVEKITGHSKGVVERAF